MNSSQPDYCATASHPDWGEAEVPGRVRIEPEALVFTVQDAACALPLQGLTIERDRSGRLCFTHPDNPDCQIFTPDDTILENYFLKRRHALQIRDLRHQREGWRNLKVAIVFLAAFALLVGLVWGLTGAVVRFLANRVPATWERQLGDRAYAEIRQEVEVVTSPQWPPWFAAVTNQLMQAHAAAGHSFEFLMIDEPLPNAAALPGGRILVCTGLCSVVQTPEEMAGVLAHEMAHVTKRHGLRQLIATLGPYYMLRVFISDERGFLSLVSGGSQLVLRQTYSRKLETEADVAAWRHLLAANIDPRGLSRFFRKLLANERMRWLELALPRLLHSHPPTAERLARLDQLWQASPRKSGFVDFGAKSGVDTPGLEN